MLCCEIDLTERELFSRQTNHMTTHADSHGVIFYVVASLNFETDDSEARVRVLLSL